MTANDGHDDVHTHMSAKKLLQAQHQSERGNALMAVTLGAVGRQRSLLHRMFMAGLAPDEPQHDRAKNGHSGE